jgi:hypothetical protein
VRATSLLLLLLLPQEARRPEPSESDRKAALKTIQEIITLVVFSGFSLWYLKQDIKWNYVVGFFFIVVAAFFIFKKW